MNILFIGGGHMARSLVGGLSAHHQQTAISVVEHNADKRQQLHDDFAVDSLPTPPDRIASDAVVLAVRPPQIRQACEALGAHQSLIISVAAGIRLASLASWLGDTTRIIRVMPNTPAEVGLGMSVCCANAHVTPADRQLTEKIFNAVGVSAWVDNEKLLDVATAATGSAPAYVYYFIDAMRQAASDMGMPNDVALPAILQTVRGAVAMLETGKHDAAALCKAVAVPGGTTERALNVFDEKRIKETVANAMRACAQRATEIGDELANAD